MNTPAQIMAALKTVLAGVTNLSTSTVSVNDWTVQNNPYSIVIFPSLGGQQQMIHVGGFEQMHRIKLLLNVKNQSDAALYDNTAAMIPLILTALASNDDLGLTDVITCHYEGHPVTWDSPSGDAILIDDNGVKAKQVAFVVTVVTT